MAKSQKSVVLNIRKVNLAGPSASISIELGGARNALASEYSKPVNGMTVGAGKLVLEPKGVAKLTPSNAAMVKLTSVTSYTKVKMFSAKGLELARGADSIELDVTDGRSLDRADGRRGFGNQPGDDDLHGRLCGGRGLSVRLFAHRVTV